MTIWHVLLLIASPHPHHHSLIRTSIFLEFHCRALLVLPLIPIQPLLSSSSLSSSFTWTPFHPSIRHCHLFLLSFLIIIRYMPSVAYSTLNSLKKEIELTDTNWWDYCLLPHTHTHTHTYTHTHTHTHTRTYTYTHTHIHTHVPHSLTWSIEFPWHMFCLTPHPVWWLHNIIHPHHASALHCTALHHTINLSFYLTCLCMDALQCVCVLQVSRWTKSVDLFMMDLVLVPINLDSHWSLVVILRPGLLLVSTHAYRGH